MKKSVRSAGPGPAKLGKGSFAKGLLFDRGGALRRGVRLILALAALLLSAWAVPFLLTRLSALMFSVWGVTAENAGRAPGWVQGLYGGWLYLVSLAQGGAIALAALLAGRSLGFRVRMGKGIAFGLLLGAGAAAGMILAFRLADVMRFGHALSRPQWSGLAVLLAVSAAAQALGAALATGLVGEALSGWRRPLALAGCAGFYALLFGRWTPAGLASGALFGLLTWLWREKKGGFSPAFGFLAMFSVLTVAVFGLPPWQPGALYETYPVSKPWLTGGEAGPWAGLFLTALLAALTLAAALPSRRARAAAPAPRATRRPSGKS